MAQAEAARGGDEAPFRAFADRMLAAANAATASGPSGEASVGPLRVTVAAAEGGLLERFLRGLARVPATGPGLPLRVHLLAGASGDTPPPPAWPLPSRTQQHLRRLHLSPGLRLYSWNDGAVWYLHDPASAAAVYWAREAAAIPEWDYGAPLRNLLAWALHDVGRLLLHGAVIGRPERALLVAGAGGAGKSSTTLAALRRAGLQTVGDDFVALAPDGTTAEALFDTVKLDAPALERLGVPAAWVANPERPAGEKARLHLRSLLPEALAATLPVRALAVPRVVDSEASRALPLAPGAVLRALAPSSLFLIPGAEAERFRCLAALTQRLPCYALELGRDPQGVAELVEGLLRGLP